MYTANVLTRFCNAPVTLYYVMLRYNYVGDALLLRHFTMRKTYLNLELVQNSGTLKNPVYVLPRLITLRLRCLTLQLAVATSYHHVARRSDQNVIVWLGHYAECLVGLHRLTHQEWVPHICISKLSHQGSIDTKRSSELIAGFYHMYLWKQILLKLGSKYASYLITVAFNLFEETAHVLTGVLWEAGPILWSCGSGSGTSRGNQRDRGVSLMM